MGTRSNIAENCCVPGNSVTMEGQRGKGRKVQEERGIGHISIGMFALYPSTGYGDTEQHRGELLRSEDQRDDGERRVEEVRKERGEPYISTTQF